MGEVSFHLIATNGFHITAENERFTAVGWRCHPKISLRHLADYVEEKDVKETRAARAERLFFLFQPITSSICGKK